MNKITSTGWNLTNLIHMKSTMFVSDKRYLVGLVKQFLNEQAEIRYEPDLGGNPQYEFYANMGRPFLSDIITMQMLYPDLIFEVDSGGNIIVWSRDDNDNDQP